MHNQCKRTVYLFKWVIFVINKKLIIKFPSFVANNDNKFLSIQNILPSPREAMHLIFSKFLTSNNVYPNFDKKILSSYTYFVILRKSFYKWQLK